MLLAMAHKMQNDLAPKKAMNMLLYQQGMCVCGGEIEKNALALECRAVQREKTRF